MADTSEWIEHDGGPCPVPVYTFVLVRYADGYEEGPGQEAFARCYMADDELPKEFVDNGDWWQHEAQDPSNNIIAYRVVKP